MSLMGVRNLAELDPAHVRLRKRSLRLARRSVALIDHLQTNHATHQPENEQHLDH